MSTRQWTPSATTRTWPSGSSLTALSALSSFALSDEECGAIVDALREDVEEAQGDVAGFAQVDVVPVSLNHLMDVGRSFGGGGVPGVGGQAGWIDIFGQSEA